jgi:hypothetical protein
LNTKGKGFFLLLLFLLNGKSGRLKQLDSKVQELWTGIFLSLCSISLSDHYSQTMIMTS